MTDIYLRLAPNHKAIHSSGMKAVKCYGYSAVIDQFHNHDFCLFVCVEVLRPSQPNGVMSSAVSLPNHTFTGQA